jgi:hypothetical protein
MFLESLKTRHPVEIFDGVFSYNSIISTVGEPLSTLAHGRIGLPGLANSKAVELVFFINLGEWFL